MSHEADEVRPNWATRQASGGPATGPEPADGLWPGPSGLGGPGSEELPVRKGAAGQAEEPEPGGSYTRPGHETARPAGEGWTGQAAGGDEHFQPGRATGPEQQDIEAEQAMGPEQTIRTEQTTGTVGKAPAGNGGNGASGDAARQRDEYLDALLRLQAEFDNYRKRMQRQQREIVDNAATSLVKKLLPVLDTADLALAHGGGEDVKQVASALFEILSKEGLERIDPEGQPFDPAHHDAVAHEPVEGQGAPEMPEVSEVLRAGYLWKGQVLRPAMVKVRG